MGRRHVDVPVIALALRRAEAAAALGLSVETFDEHVRPDLPVVRIGGVVAYPVRGLHSWLERHEEQPASTSPRRKAA